MHGLNTYDYGARQYNSLVGRWDRMDPLCEKYYSISPYAYCLNNPIRMIDKDGRAPGDHFSSADDAALDFGLIYNTYSILQNKEYASYIDVAIDKSGNPYYSYTIPKKGTEDSSSSSTNGAPKNARVKASAHTHADSDKKYGKGNEQFSPTDIESAKSENLDSYVFTPNGKELKFDVKTDKVSRIDNGEIPYSKKKNANGRTYVVGNYTPQGNKDRLKMEEKKYFYQLKWDLILQKIAGH